jgi:prenyltransferase beta subunit
MRRHRRPRAVIGALCALMLLGAFRYSGFSDAQSKATAARATKWLDKQQLPDGSFEVAQFPGFETPDAVLAIAENAQTTAKWNKNQALAAVSAVKNGGNSALHALDDFVDSGIDAGQAAKVIVLDAKPLGLSPTNFNPDKDKTKVNLAAIVTAAAQPNGSYGTFNATLYAALALRLLDGSVPASTVAYIRAAQQANGGWTFSGDPTGSDVDIDTTGLAVQALAAAKVAKTDATLRSALAFLGAQQQTDGAWQSFGADDPNSTSVAVMAITASGFDPVARCWRDVVDPARHGEAYKSPVVWLRKQQASDGHITSPNDSFGVNTFATSQSIQALRREWVPITPLAKQACT